MFKFYESGNLIVRTDSFDSLVDNVYSDIKKQKENLIKRQSRLEETINLSLWKQKVDNSLNDEKNLTKDNFPSLMK
tara:strand:- start:366 stop:593 length:228 start_codon:yes stop_codon:yes gene_type:complete